MMQNEVIRTILARKGTKAYKKDPISDEIIDILLECGRAAPNAFNAQAWHFTAVTNASILAELEEKTLEALIRCGVCEKGSNYHAYYDAPAVIAISAKKDSEFRKQDCSAANQNIAIAAKSLGIGSRFLDVPNNLFNAPGGERYKEMLGIPEGYETVCFLCLGYPEDPDERPTIKKTNVVSRVR